MKKNLFFLILILFIGCTPNTEIKTKISCPTVKFAFEHSKYISSNIEPISLDNVAYSANLNNYNFNSKCYLKEKIFYSELSLLFIVEPINVTTSNINLPYYVAIINEEDELIDIQYYQIDGFFDIDEDSTQSSETELTTTINIKILNADDKVYLKNKIIIGFLLDNKKLEILN